MAALATVGSWVRDVARAIAGRTRAGDPTAFNDPTFAWSPRLRRLLGQEMENPFSEHPWVFRCVLTIVDHLTSVEFCLRDGPSDSPTEIESGPWYDLFLSPSTELTRRELWSLTAHYFLGGGAYWVLYGRLGLVTSEKEVPTEIQCWPARMVKAKKAEGKLDHYELDMGKGERVRLELFQVVPLRRIDPNSPMGGLDMLTPAKRSVRTDDKASRWNEGLLDNDATPGGIISSEQELSTEQSDAIKKRWRDLHGGPDRHGDIAVLGAGSKYQATGITPKDMGFSEMLTRSKDEIAAVYGVPLMYLGDVSTIHSKESARIVEQLLWKQTLIPILRIWEDILESRLFSTRGTLWGAFDTDDVDALQEQMDARIANAKSARELGVTRNELNRRFDLGFELEDGLGDVALVPMSLRPLEVVEADVELLDAPPPEPPTAPAPVNDIDPEPDPADPQEQPEGENEGRVFGVRKKRRSAEREAMWRAYRDSLRPYESRMAKTVRGYWRRLRSDTLDAVAAMSEDRGLLTLSTREMSAQELDAWLAQQHDRWEKNLIERTKPIEASTMEFTLERLEAQVGQALVVVDMTHPAILSKLAERGGEKIKVVDTIQKGIRNSLLKGLADQESLTQLQDRVRNVFRAANARTMAIARTETAAASTGAKYSAMKAEGIPNQSWLSSGDANVRESHQIDGETRALGEAFSNGLLYPLDPAGPPEEVIQCNCEALPEG